MHGLGHDKEVYGGEEYKGGEREREKGGRVKGRLELFETSAKLEIGVFFPGSLVGILWTPLLETWEGWKPKQEVLVN